MGSYEVKCSSSPLGSPRKHVECGETTRALTPPYRLACRSRRCKALTSLVLDAQQLGDAVFHVDLVLSLLVAIPVRLEEGSVYPHLLYAEIWISFNSLEGRNAISGANYRIDILSS